ncbi:MAG TPA: CHAT domain-containing protein, partial [Gammaproteobacteria bacterium]|nr:CHAT domain-containing protein [Gammaproteobacteria bacterium]
ARHRNVVVVADGELQRLPFGVLRMGNAQTMLGSDHDLVYLPSVSTLRLIRDVQRPTSATGALAIFADPVFRADDPRLPAMRNRQGSAKDLAAASGDIGLANLPPLPYSLREAEAIRARAGKARVWLASGFAANRAAVLHADWSRYAIVHFASHSLLDMQRPELSGIVLSLYQSDGRAVDGFLRVSDLYDLDMPVNLVVLGSCDSAVGPNPGSEGVFSLARALFYAGARRTLASLWPVDDRASAQFMSLFYTALLTDHEAAPAALRQARMTMAADPQYRQPYYWAGYVLQGDWQ